MKKIKHFSKVFILNWLIPNPFISEKMRVYLCCKLGAQFSVNARANQGFRLKNPKELKVGSNSFFNDRCVVFNEYASVTIGSFCAIATEVMLCTTTHVIGGEGCRASDQVIGIPIIIEDGCWIGARSTILPGVVIKKGCIIAAGSVVTKDCEPNGLYAGVPAKRIKDLPTSKTEKRMG